MGATTGPAPAAIFTLHDMALAADVVRHRHSNLIDEDTPIGAYVRQLEREREELKDQVDYWRRGWEIAVDERRRAEAKVSDLEGKLDAALDGIPISTDESPRRPARFKPIKLGQYRASRRHSARTEESGFILPLRSGRQP